MDGALEELPAAVSADLLESGMVLTGGGSPLAGLVERISKETGLNLRQPSTRFNDLGGQSPSAAG